MTQAWSIRPIVGAGQAIELEGLDPETLVDPAVTAELNRLWVEHGVIVFKGINDADTHVRLSECFGPCQVHPIKQINTDPGKLALTNVQYGPDNENGNIWSVNGTPRGAWLPLHFDLVYVDKVNHGGLLRPIQIPPTGGETTFVDKITLYDTLPDHLREKAEGLEIVYHFNLHIPDARFLTDDVQAVKVGRKFQDANSRRGQYPRSIHPLVYAQAETGRKMLNLSPWFAEGVVGMDDDEGDALLAVLCRHVQESPHVYHHAWQMGDLVLWDNWRVLHGAAGTDPQASRWLQRTTIAGDYSLGRLETSHASVDELSTVDV